jgi:NADH dehydrogenase
VVHKAVDRGRFAGFHYLRRLERLLPPEAAELVVVSPTDYMPYLPLLPEVGAGIVDRGRVR